MPGTDFPLLSLIIFLPLFGAVVTSMMGDNRLVKLSALTFAGLELALTLLALHLFDKTSGDFQLTEKFDWIPFLNIEYLLGIDGISILFLPLSALLTMTVILASWNAISYNQRFHFSLILALQGITAGVFTSLDMILFFFFWELTLPPLFFLIGLWGIGSQRRNAAMKYTLFMLAGGGPLLLAIVIMAANHASQTGGNFPQDLSFSLPVLLETPLLAEKQTLVFVLLLFGFAFKAPLFPFHTWLPTTAIEGPTHIVALLAGLKLGVYGILRFAMPLAPDAAAEFSWILSVFGAATLIYGGLIARAMIISGV
ncbi:MAG: proton-conducting transporter membrane subunit [Nitrosomonas sp.]|nr:proton-conducting transporter membrane subunit [Nitrosomonas sp.]